MVHANQLCSQGSLQQWCYHHKVWEACLPPAWLTVSTWCASRLTAYDDHQELGMQAGEAGREKGRLAAVANQYEDMTWYMMSQSLALTKVAQRRGEHSKWGQILSLIQSNSASDPGIIGVCMGSKVASTLMGHYMLDILFGHNPWLPGHNQRRALSCNSISFYNRPQI